MLFVCVSAFQDAEWLAETLPALRVGVTGQPVQFVYVDGAYKGFLEAARFAETDPAVSRWLAQTEGPPLPTQARSTDGSIEMAREYGFRVIEVPEGGWEDECVKRSAYLVGQPGDWYFVVDADEVLEGVLPQVEGLQADSYQVTMLKEGCRHMRKPYPLPGRLFRHLAGMVYHGAHASVSVPDATMPDGWRMLYNRQEWEGVGEGWPVIPADQCWLRHRTIYRDARRKNILKGVYCKRLQEQEEAYRRRHGCW